MIMEGIIKANWSAQEDELLLSLIDRGVRRSDLPRFFPHRTIHAVRSRYDQVMRKLGRTLTLKKRSEDFAEKINALIDRMPANDVAIMLGKPHLVIPGTERVLKTCAVERIAA